MFCLQSFIYGELHLHTLLGQQYECPLCSCFCRPEPVTLQVTTYIEIKDTVQDIDPVSTAIIKKSKNRLSHKKMKKKK